ncbi:MAG TPA: ketohydroxyglutarate aldolase [Sphingobium sp.]|nr:ketohydroxyglutarate aldolase [Sphingobium sp.]
MAYRAGRERQGAARIAARIVTAIVAGYAILYFVSDALGLALVSAQWTTRADAVLIATNLAFLLAPAVVIWVFAAGSMWRAVGLPFVVAALLMALAGVLQP